MRVTVHLHGYPEKGKRLSEELAEGATGHDLLRRLGVPSEAVLLFRGDAPAPIDAPLEPGEEVRVVRIVSGG